MEIIMFFCCPWFRDSITRIINIKKALTTEAKM
jgi:hypothetical protein